MIDLTSVIAYVGESDVTCDYKARYLENIAYSRSLSEDFFLLPKAGSICLGDSRLVFELEICSTCCVGGSVLLLFPICDK